MKAFKSLITSTACRAVFLCVGISVIAFLFFRGFLANSTHTGFDVGVNRTLQANRWPSPAVKPVACTSQVGAGFNLQCGVLTTALARGEFQLEFAVLRHKQTEQSVKNRRQIGDDLTPVVYLEGGPGVGDVTNQSSIDFWQMFIVDAGLDRDVVLVNTRGNIGSSPYYECVELANSLRNILTMNISFEDELTYLVPKQQACLEGYNQFLISEVAYPAGLVHPGIGVLSSHLAQQDVTQLMRGLGYGKWHVWGGSYGGRLALLAGQVPEVKSIILDSPYLFQSGTLDRLPGLLLQARKNHKANYPTFLQGLGSADAARAPASYELLIAAVLTKINTAETPIEIPLSNQPIDKIVLTEENLANIEFTVLYDSALWASYYQFLLDIHAAGSHINSEFYERFDVKLVLDMYLETYGTDTFNLASYHAIECLDNTQASTADVKMQADMVADEYFPATAYKSQDVRKKAISTWAEQWVALADKNICNHPMFSKRKSVQGQAYPPVPIAVFAGDKDPITPANTLAELPDRKNIYTFTLPDWGHGVVFGYTCNPAAISRTLKAFDAGEAVDLYQLCNYE